MLQPFYKSGVYGLAKRVLPGRIKAPIRRLFRRPAIITQEMLALHRDIAASFDVQPHIHAEDFIYWYHGASLFLTISVVTRSHAEHSKVRL